MPRSRSLSIPLWRYRAISSSSKFMADSTLKKTFKTWLNSNNSSLNYPKITAAIMGTLYWCRSSSCEVRALALICRPTQKRGSRSCSNSKCLTICISSLRGSSPWSFSWSTSHSHSWCSRGTIWTRGWRTAIQISGIGTMRYFKTPNSWTGRPFASILWALSSPKLTFQTSRSWIKLRKRKSTMTITFWSSSSPRGLKTISQRSR